MKGSYKRQGAGVRESKERRPNEERMILNPRGRYLLPEEPAKLGRTAAVFQPL